MSRLAHPKSRRRRRGAAPDFRVLVMHMSRRALTPPKPVDFGRGRLPRTRRPRGLEQNPGQVRAMKLQAPVSKPLEPRVSSRLRVTKHTPCAGHAHVCMQIPP